MSTAATSVMDWSHVPASSRCTVRSLSTFCLMQWWQGVFF